MSEEPVDELAEWTKKLRELRHLTIVAIPVGVLAGVGVSGLEAICTRTATGQLSWSRRAVAGGLVTSATAAVAPAKVGTRHQGELHHH